MVLKFLTKGKGELTLSVTDRVYELGATVEGSVTIETRKNIGPGRLFVALLCIEEVTRMETDRNGNRRRDTDRREIFRTEQDLALDASYGSDHTESFDFALTIPAGRDEPSPAGVPGWAQTLGTVFSAMSAMDRRAWWAVEARYDIPRMDLKDRTKISVNQFG